MLVLLALVLLHATQRPRPQLPGRQLQDHQ
jgi:hypothetical protein